jgi:hypothetical protein
LFSKSHLKNIFLRNKSVLQSTGYSGVTLHTNKLELLDHKKIEGVRCIQSFFRSHKDKELKKVKRDKDSVCNDDAKFLDFVIEVRPVSEIGKSIKELNSLRKVEQQRDKEIDSKKLKLTGF